MLEPYLPPPGRRGGRSNDHWQAVNGILFQVRTGIPWRELPERFGGRKTVYERHRRWSADGTSDRILHAVRADADLAGRVDRSMAGMDSTSCRAHQHAAGTRKKTPRVPKIGITPRNHRPDEGLGRHRGGLPCKIHLAGEGGCRPLVILLTPDQFGDAPQMTQVLDRIRGPRPRGGRPRIRADHLSADKAYGSRQNRPYLRRRQIKHGISEPKDQRAHRKRRGSKGGRPTGFDSETYKRRNEVERTINRLKNPPSRRYPLPQEGLRVPRHRHHRSHQTPAPTMIRQTDPSSPLCRTGPAAETAGTSVHGT